MIYIYMYLYGNRYHIFLNFRYKILIYKDSLPKSVPTIKSKY